MSIDVFAGVLIVHDKKDEISRTQQKIRTLTLQPFHKALFKEVDWCRCPRLWIENKRPVTTTHER